MKNLDKLNQKFIHFCSSTIFRIKESVIYPDINIIINTSTFRQFIESQSSKFESDLQLENLHHGVKLYLSNDFSFYTYLNKIISQNNNEWTDVFIDTFIQYQEHPDPLFRIKLLETISPVLSDHFFVNQLKSNYRYLKNNSNNEKFNFDVTRLSNEQYLLIIDLLKTMHINIDNADSIDMNFIQDILSIICEYGKIHPTKFILVRAELVCGNFLIHLHKFGLQLKKNIIT